MPEDRETIESILRHSIRLLDALANPAVDADDRRFIEQEIVRTDALLLDRRRELPELSTCLRLAPDAHSIAVADYISRLLRSYDAAATAAEAAIANAARKLVQRKTG